MYEKRKLSKIFDLLKYNVTEASTVLYIESILLIFMIGTCILLFLWNLTNGYPSECEMGLYTCALKKKKRWLEYRGQTNRAK